MNKSVIKHYRSIFISDVHLGTKNCQAELLIDFLKKHSCDNLYLVGDIIDGWKLKRKFKWPSKHNLVIQQIINKSKNGSKVIYIPGNHDEFIRKWLHIDISFGSIEFHNDYVHVGVDGKKYLVTHGDLFDGITRLAKWVSVLGDNAYEFLIDVNSLFNRIRHKLGFGYWSLSKFLKHNVKKAVTFIFDFEQNIVTYCKKRHLNGIICGHIHTPAIKQIDDIIYMNDGDWVESCSALVEHEDGTFEIIYWHNHTKATNNEKDNHSN